MSDHAETAEQIGGSNAEDLHDVFDNSHTVILSRHRKNATLTGSRAGLRVPYREISLSATHHSDRTEENPPLPVYDTSGPYTDPEVRIDLGSRTAQPSHGLDQATQRYGDP